MLAAIVGIPVYTPNLTALPLVSGLLEQGMLPGRAFAKSLKQQLQSLVKVD
jgi:uncharacterized membrane protein YraQ (UPF0718 family)